MATNMLEVGVRELKASLSQMLRLAKEGERVRVTVHGEAVADIVAPGDFGDEDRLRVLALEGRLVPPARPPRLIRTSRSASALVLEERDVER